MDSRKRVLFKLIHALYGHQHFYTYRHHCQFLFWFKTKVFLFLFDSVIMSPTKLVSTKKPKVASPSFLAWYKISFPFLKISHQSNTYGVCKPFSVSYTKKIKQKISDHEPKSFIEIVFSPTSQLSFI